MLNKRIWLPPCLLLLGLAGCGFHLRGSNGDYKFPYSRMYIDCQTPVICPNFIRTVKNERLTTLVSSQESAEAIVEISNEQTSRDAYSYNSVGQIASYILTYQVTARVYDPQGNQIGNDLLVNNHMIMAYNNSLILSAQQQEASDWDLIHQNIINALIRRLVYFHTSLISSDRYGTESY